MDKNTARTLMQIRLEDVPRLRKLPPENGEFPDWDAEAVAFARTDQGRQTCLAAMGKIAGSKRYQQEANRLEISSNNIVRAAKRLSAQITEKTDNVEKYWSGIRSYKFTKNRSACPKCKEIFN